MEFPLKILWQCGYCNNKNFEDSTYCSSCFIPIKDQPDVLRNEFYKKQILLFWTDLNDQELPTEIHGVIWKFFENKQEIIEWSRPKRLKFGSFYSAGAFYRKYCSGKKWHKSLGECDVDKYSNVNVYDCTKEEGKSGHILFHFGFMKETYKNGDYSFDYETKGVYYYVKDGSIFEM